LRATLAATWPVRTAAEEIAQEDRRRQRVDAADAVAHGALDEGQGLGHVRERKTSSRVGFLGTHAQLSWLDRGLEAFAETTLDEGAKAELVLLLNGYVFWAARLRFQVPSDVSLEVVPPEFDLSAFPSLARALEAGIFEDESSTRDEDFTFGLERVLDGIEALIQRSGA
jgi:hypothetical protein